MSLRPSGRKKNLQNIVHKLAAKGINLEARQQPVDPSTAAGTAFLDMLGVFVEFESSLCRERQLEGIAAATARASIRGAGRLSTRR